MQRAHITVSFAILACAALAACGGGGSGGTPPPPTQVNLTWTGSGTGGGDVTASATPAGVSCGPGCISFDEGTSVTLTATATPDSTFSGWGGACSGTSATCTLTMSAAKAVSAAFAFSAPISNGGNPYCYLPYEFSWTSTGPLATPATGFVSLKDFTTTVKDGKHLVYMSDVNPSFPNPPYGSAFMSFSDWTAADGSDNMDAATQVQMTHRAVAPTLFYFAPKTEWVLAYQWGAHQFSYRTSSDPTNPNGWEGENALYDGGVPGAVTAPYGPIDQTVICDSANCYLFFAGDNGVIYRSSMAIGSFPGTFPAATVLMSAPKNDLFEAVQVYTIEGTGEYLMLVECIGANGRYFRSYKATDLGGEWTPLAATEANPFAGHVNVTFPAGVWTHDISHGDLVRNDNDQTFTVNACNLQMLYQGYAVGSSTSDYNLIPWRPGLLTQQTR